MKIISVGEVLWDVIDGAEHPGGAPFNFAAHAKQLGHEVLFVSAVGRDPRGQGILNIMAEFGLSTRYVHSQEGNPTGFVTVSVDSSGQPDYVIHRPAAYDFPQLATGEVEELLFPAPAWIYYGTLQQMSPVAHELLLSLLRSSRNVHRLHRFYDLNLRRNCYTPGLVHELMEHATVLKLNQQEAGEIANMFGDSCGSLESFCRSYTQRFQWEAVCVTRGDQGCVILMGDRYIESPACAVRVIDTVGAGDAFSAAFVHGFSANWEPDQIADFANRVGALVASRRGAVPIWTIEEALQFTQKE